MALNLTTRILGDVTVIDLSGRLALGTGPVALRELLREVTAGGSRKIVLNLTDLSFMDSSGLGELVSSHVNAKHNGASLKMTGLSKRIQEVFQMTGVYRVLDAHFHRSRTRFTAGVETPATQVIADPPAASAVASFDNFSEARPQADTSQNSPNGVSPYKARCRNRDSDWAA